ncbi:MAG: 30S ribosomal protein S16 [Patescibacteria group bacterium]
MLKIRLQRVGRKNDPSFRVVCTDSKKGPKSGNNVEILGSYDPKQNNVAIKGDRVKHWVSQGAQVSDTVNNILIKEGIIKGKKVHVSRGKKNTRNLSAEAEVNKNTSVEEVKEETVEKTATENAPADEETSKEAPVHVDAPTEERVKEVPVDEPKEEEKKEA